MSKAIYLEKRAPYYVSIADAFSSALLVVKETRGKKITDERAFTLMMTSCKEYKLRDDTSVFKMSEVEKFILNLTKACETGDSSYLLMRRGLKVDRVVDIQEFCESSEYMGQKGAIRPVVMNDLIELFGSENSEGYIECVLTGSIGWGKTYFSELSIAYMIYRLSCYHNPQLEYELAPGSSIVFIQQSMKYELAKKVVFTQFAERVKQSKYFKNFFPYDPGVKSELRFPSNIYVLPVGGGDTAALGMNVFGGIIDEMNFMARVQDSMATRFTGEEEYDQAERVYRSLIRRMKSRFMQKGLLPGKLLLVSSVNYPGDFTDRKVKEAKSDESILALSHSQWDALPADRFSGEKFLVELGNDEKQSRIIENEADAYEKEDIIEIPVEYKTDFIRDIEAALKDYAGFTCSVKRPFIPYKELIVGAQREYKAQTGFSNLFLKESVVLNDVIDPLEENWEDIIDMDYLETVILSDKVPFAVHIDLAISGDAVGLSVGRIAGYKLLPSTKFYDVKRGDFVEVKDIRAPIYQIDGALQICSPVSGEIDLELVRDLVIWLRGRWNIKWGTMDSYQSAMMIQSFRKVKIRSGVLSMDTSIAPYAELKLSIKDERLLIPDSEILFKELRELEKDKEKDKVDHPAGGSKDVADSVAGVVYMLHTREANYRTSRRSGRRGRESAPSRKSVRKIRVGGSVAKKP